jgi:hypothetical protein
MQVPSNIQRNPLAQSEDYILGISPFHQVLSGKKHDANIGSGSDV